MEFPDYDCQKVGFLKTSSDIENFHDIALQKANLKQCIYPFNVTYNKLGK